MEINSLISNLFISQKHDDVFNATDYISINDKVYLDFIENFNGGFFFEQTLHLYSAIKINLIPNITDMNILLFSQYGKIIEGLTFFGQDIFGNQFAFERNKIIFFNIESGEREYLANNFTDFLLILKEDRDYYTGLPYYYEWRKNNSKLNLNERLCPKIPFVLGGEYEMKNLYSLNMEKNIEYNASIANQIYNLPDGTPIKYKIIE